MNAVLAIIADGGQAINVIDRVGVDSTKTLWRRPRPTQCALAPGGGVRSSIKTMPLEGKRLHHGGDVCVLVFN